VDVLLPRHYTLMGVSDPWACWRVDTSHTIYGGVRPLHESNESQDTACDLTCRMNVVVVLGLRSRVQYHGDSTRIWYRRTATLDLFSMRLLETRLVYRKLTHFFFTS
jgi:hypothetical protein